MSRHEHGWLVMKDRTNGSGAGGRAPHHCVECGRAVTPEFAPFCSRRCADIDLGRWLSGSYVIPGRPLGLGDDDDEET